MNDNEHAPFACPAINVSLALSPPPVAELSQAARADTRRNAHARTNKCGMHTCERFFGTNHIMSLHRDAVFIDKRLACGSLSHDVPRAVWTDWVGSCSSECVLYE